jgi:hypothetical protein
MALTEYDKSHQMRHPAAELRTNTQKYLCIIRFLWLAVAESIQT